MPAGFFVYGKAADAPQVLPHFFLFKRQLGIIGKGLQLAAAAGAGHRTQGLDSVRRGLQHLQQLRIGVALFVFNDLGAHVVPHHCVLNEKRVTVSFSDTRSVFCHIFDKNVDDLILIHGLTGVVLLTLLSQSF